MYKRRVILVISMLTVCSIVIGAVGAAEDRTVATKTKDDSGVQAEQNISEEEQRKIIKEKEKTHKRLMRWFRKHKQQAPRVQPKEDLFFGILEADQAPGVYPLKFKILNSWAGDIEGKGVDVYAGHWPQNPLQGVLLIFESASDPGQSYPTPNATGPVRIISETDGVLVLESIAGAFEMHDAEGNRFPNEVRTLGGTTYLFDISTHTYR